MHRAGIAERAAEGEAQNMLAVTFFPITWPTN
eukprot:SAG31_NODE_22911_length_515_cov_1.326923_2_plen_31_part_01